MSDTEMMAWIIGSGATLWAANWTRLKVATYVIEKAIKDYEPQLQAFREFQPVKWKSQTPEQKQVFANFQGFLNDDAIILQKSQEFKIPLPEAPPDVLESSSKFKAYIDDLLKKIKGGHLKHAATIVTTDTLTDAILNEALVRAFPDIALEIGAGEISDIVLGEQLKNLIDQTGIIDLTVAALQGSAAVLSDEIIASMGETIADPQFGMFTLLSAINRERKLMEAGHSTPGESIWYGTQKYALTTGGAVGAGWLTAQVAGDLMAPGLGTIVVTILGGIVGALAGSEKSRELNINEIKDLTRLFKYAAEHGQTDLEKKKALIISATLEAARKALEKYETTLASRPNLSDSQKLETLVQSLRQAFNDDLNLARQKIREKHDDFKLLMPAPGKLTRFFGADWHPEIEARLQDIAHLHKEEVAKIIYMPDQKGASALVDILLATANTQILEGGYYEELFGKIGTKTTEVIEGHRGLTQMWLDQCTDARDNVGKEAVKKLKERQDIFAKTLSALKDNLDAQGKKIHAKYMRLHPDYN